MFSGTYALNNLLLGIALCSLMGEKKQATVAFTFRVKEGINDHVYCFEVC